MPGMRPDRMLGLERCEPSAWPPSIGPMPRPARTAKYIWRMAADPPLCGTGRTVQRILQCSLPRRGGYCHCLFDVNEIVDDLTEAQGIEAAGGWFEADIESEDVAQLIRDFRVVKIGVGRLPLDNAARDEVAQRIQQWIARFSELEEAGAGLTGRYSDDLDV